MLDFRDNTLNYISIIPFRLHRLEDRNYMELIVCYPRHIFIFEGGTCFYV